METPNPESSPSPEADKDSEMKPDQANSVDIDPAIKELCFTDDIEALYKKLSVDEERLESEMESLLEQRCHLGAKMAGLQKMAPSLQFVHADADQLSKMISFTTTLAINVSAKVRQLDRAKTRVASAQQRVNDLLDLKLCAEGVQTALQAENFEQAAAHVHRFLAIDESVVRLSEAGRAGDNLSSAFALLHRAEAELHAAVEARFAEAVRADDLASIERFFKIFPLLNRHDEGVKKFAEYLCSKLEVSAAKNLKEAERTSSSDARAAVIWADTITLLFEGIARLVEIHQPIIETFYGPGWLMATVELLQATCDKEVGRIVASFSKHRQLTARVSRVHESLRASRAAAATAAASSPASAPDPRELDPLLGELIIMHARAELYVRFVRRRVMSDIEVGFFDNERAEKAAKLESIIKGSELSRCMQELVGHYISLESYYLTECISKAVKLDTIEEGSLTSSMIDDVFFIIKKCIRRALSGGSVDGTCAMINIASTLLETEFSAVLERYLRQGFPSGYLDLSQAYSALQTSLQQGKLHAADTDAQKTQFLTALNNARASQEYVASLCATLRQEATAQLGGASAHERDKLFSCLASLEAASSRFDTLAEVGLKQLRSSAIKPRVKPWADGFTAVSHDITEDEFSQYEADDPFVSQLVARVDGLLASFRDALLPASGQALVRAVIEEIATQLERNVLKSRFNRLGGLQFDKEVRSLTTYLSSVTTWSERDRLARLSQMATLLNLEQVSEIAEYWGSSAAMTWKLTPAEVRKVMLLRVDFKPEEVKRLKL
ncbi:conserved oligomeric Golgi complex subunit 4-like [Pollicipes pollicipes]|uniref:conserved oligomeric Golgi complex subunit 4-like n=1 Tax=Pollicipes pollicipes TaxID=41117 RepID=UPI0018851445|nr:conserved oligomeric Golgi complex subunit 4-like [Pollicipes pollicipes]XP_037085564.1 conserved oligomeric Golgi complex subunit 4-like [Pollicipes pollicipes]